MFSNNKKDFTGFNKFIESARGLSQTDRDNIIYLLQDINREQAIKDSSADIDYPNLGICPEILLPFMEEWFICFLEELFSNYAGDYGVRLVTDDTVVIKTAINSAYDDDEADQDQYPRVTVVADGMQSSTAAIGELDNPKIDLPLDLSTGRAWLHTQFRINVVSKSRPEANIIAGIIFANLFSAAPLIRLVFNLHDVFPPQLTSARLIQQNNELYKAIITFKVWSSMAWQVHSDNKKTYRKLLLKLEAKLRCGMKTGIMNVIGVYDNKFINRMKKIIENWES